MGLRLRNIENKPNEYYHLDIRNGLIFWGIAIGAFRGYERFLEMIIRNVNMMTKQVEGCMFHFARLEESNKENCSINCNAAFRSRKRKHLGYITILRQPKSQIISTLIWGYYIILIHRPAPGGMGIKFVSRSKSIQTKHHWLSYIMY